MSGTFLPSYGDNDVGVADLAISFVGANGADPTESTIRGRKYATITRAAEGVYTLTLDGAYKQLNFAVASIYDTDTEDTTNDASYATIYVPDETASPLVVKVKCWKVTDGADADIEADDCDGKRVCVLLKVKTSMGA